MCERSEVSAMFRFLIKSIYIHTRKHGFTRPESVSLQNTFKSFKYDTAGHIVRVLSYSFSDYCFQVGYLVVEFTSMIQSMRACCKLARATFGLTGLSSDVLGRMHC